MAARNFANRTVWTADCLYVLRGMNSASVDLIYLDPPFNSKADYSAPIGSRAAGAGFKDTWSLSDVDAEWVNLMEARHPALYRVLLAAMTDSDKSYLAYMAARLLEMRRVLKPSGSIYLHCDPTMGAYLKLVMDAIFSPKNFRNEIIWKRTQAHSLARQYHARVHDTILYYSRGEDATWNQLYMPYDRSYVQTKYRHVEPETGRRYRLDNTTAKGNTPYEVLGVTRPYRFSPDNMAGLIREGRVIQTKPGTVPQYKRYLDEMPGILSQDIWLDVRPLNSQAKERLGYPTQKPLALLERIIKASSNEGDTVLDPFCGCATTLVAAESEGREWAGIDLSPKAVELVRHRLADTHGAFGQIVARTDVPRPTDLGKLPAPKTHRTALYGLQGGFCLGCDEHFQPRHLEVDHIIARAKGGTDHIENLQLLCGHCNRVKGDRGMAYLRTKLQLHT